MSYYGSNYGGYGGGAAYPPPSSGPPPPPMGGYGGHPGGYGGSAYNVNQYSYGGGYGGGYGGYQTGHAPPPGGQYGSQGYQMSGAVPGFTVPAVQQCSAMYRGQQPQHTQMPQTVNYDSYNNMMLQQQMQMQQMFQEQAKALKAARQQLNEQQEEEPEEEEEKSAKGPMGLTEEVKAHLKNVYVNECMKRLSLSGTFDMTSGTVGELQKYPAEDPVVEFHKNHKDGDGEDLTGKKWSAEMDCLYLRWAMKGLGTNEEAIIQVVTTRCNAQRQILKKQFKTNSGRDLIKDLESELSGNFRGAVLGLFVPPAVYDAWSVKEAIYGLGTDERSLIEVMMTRTNAQINEMRGAYTDVASPNRKASDNLIEDDIRNDTSGDFKRLLISAAQGNRNEISREQLQEAVVEIERDGVGTGLFQVDYTKLADMNKAKRDAKKLYEAGEDRWGTDEETFIRIFATRDPYQLRATWDEYVKITQRDILNSVDRETSGDFKKGLYTIVASIRCRPMFFADRLVDCMKGLGTNDDDLIRIIVSRSEIDMVQIKECFLQKTKQTLWRWLKDDCSGDYKRLLQAIVGKN